MRDINNRPAYIPAVARRPKQQQELSLEEEKGMEAWWALHDLIMPDHIRDHLKSALNPLGRGLPDGY